MEDALPSNQEPTIESCALLSVSQLEELRNKYLSVVRSEGFEPTDQLFGSVDWGSHELRPPSAAASIARYRYFTVLAALDRK
jgi:hypothetical protein